MSGPHPDPSPASPSETPIFGTPATQERGGLSPAVWGIAALIVLLVAGIFFFAGRRKGPAVPTTLQPPDAYAASLPLTNLAMSESSSFSGGKVTYLDGHIQNTGSRTITAITVQVVFNNDTEMPPSIQTLPLTLVRMTQPYIDTEPVSADPLKPGDSKDFRLAFDSVPDNWNQQMPEVRIIQTTAQ
ncbi:MAG TPA: DUF2393 family protein [Phycisphaerae bacterium]|nr:DUF2393 family protein [Phycisphaerae bacterium]HWB32856.1 DUF2393 family protein [Acidobacteriaceae bacterium]